MRLLPALFQIVLSGSADAPVQGQDASAGSGESTGCLDTAPLRGVAAGTPWVVRDLTRCPARRLVYDLEHGAGVEVLRALVADDLELPPAEVVLGGPTRILLDGEALSAYGIGPEASIAATRRLCGGGEDARAKSQTGAMI